MLRLLPLLLLVVGNIYETYGELNIGFFNVQIFGVTKMSYEDVRNRLVQIFSRYDIIAMQEIRDSSETAIVDLMQLLNISNPDDPFRMVTSVRLGRTSSKEQYAYIYRWKKVFITSQYQDQDIGDVYEREPFSVKIISPYINLDDLGLMVIHAAPSDAVAEINALNASYVTAKGQLGTSNFLIGGDFNADCTYVTQSDWDSIPLKTSTSFTWWIGDEVDTTVKSTDCAYDRILSTGEGMAGAIVANTAGIFDFATAYNLNEDQADDVSDHYPVEISISGDESVDGEEESIAVTKSFIFEAPISATNKENAREIYREPERWEVQGYVVTMFKHVNSIHHVITRRTGVVDPVSALLTFPDVDLIIPAGVKIRLLHMVSDYADGMNAQSYTFGIDCQFQTPYTCKVSISV